MKKSHQIAQELLRSWMMIKLQVIPARAACGYTYANHISHESTGNGTTLSLSFSCSSVLYSLKINVTLIVSTDFKKFKFSHSNHGEGGSN